MNKKYVLLMAAVMLALLSVPATSFAATTASGSSATNELSAPTLAVDIGSSGYAETNVQNSFPLLMPGDTLGEAGFIIENTADVPFYLRVTVTKCWINGASAKNTEADAKLIKMTGGDGFLQISSHFEETSGETEVYYLAKPLMPEQTAKLNLTAEISGELDNTYQNAGIKIYATADAVQFAEGQNELNRGGLLASFGVTAQLSQDGTITGLVQ